MVHRVPLFLALVLGAAAPARAETPAAEEKASVLVLPEEIALAQQGTESLIESADVLLAPEMVAASTTPSRRREIAAAVEEFFTRAQANAYVVKDILTRLRKAPASAERSTLIQRMEPVMAKTKTLEEKVKRVGATYKPS